MDPNTFDEIQKKLEKVALWQGAHNNSYFAWELSKVECREIYDILMSPYQSHIDDCKQCEFMWGMGPIAENGSPFSSYLTRMEVEMDVNKSARSTREDCPDHGANNYVIQKHSYCMECLTPGRIPI